MLRHRAELSVLRVLAIFAAGILTGVQIALYLFDLYDDGTAEGWSGVIGLILLFLGLLLVVWHFRTPKHEPPAA